MIAAIAVLGVGVAVFFVVGKATDMAEDIAEDVASTTSSSSPSTTTTTTTTNAKRTRTGRHKRGGRTERPAPTGMPAAGLSRLAHDNTSWNHLQADGIVGNLATFDPIANAPWALKTAQAWSNDARLVRIGIDRVLPDGSVDINDKEGVDYRFYSPGRRKSELEMAKVSEQRIPTEFRIWIRGGAVKVLQSSRSMPSRDPDPPTAKITCSLATLLGIWRAKHKLPPRPSYDMTLLHRRKGQYRWSISMGRMGGGRSMPGLDAAGCKPGEDAKTIAARPPDPADYQTLKGCTCKMEKQPVKMGMRVLSSGRMITGAGSWTTYELDYLFEVGKKRFALPEAKDAAPPSSVKNGLSMAVACHRDHIIVVAGERVTAWSGSKGRMVWNSKLPGTYRQPRGSSGGLTVSCAELKLRKKDHLPIKLQGGERVTVDLRTGKVTGK